MIIEVFPYIILLYFCPNAKSAKLNSTPNLVDLQYPVTQLVMAKAARRSVPASDVVTIYMILAMYPGKQHKEKEAFKPE